MGSTHPLGLTQSITNFKLMFDVGSYLSYCMYKRERRLSHLSYKVVFSFFKMMFGVVVLAWVVNLIVFSGPSQVLELLLRFATLDPMEAHIHWFTLTLYHGADSESMSCHIIDCHGCWVYLFMVQFL